MNRFVIEDLRVEKIFSQYFNVEWGLYMLMEGDYLLLKGVFFCFRFSNLVSNDPLLNLQCWLIFRCTDLI